MAKTPHEVHATMTAEHKAALAQGGPRAAR